jgi:hypothetical protein
MTNSKCFGTDAGGLVVIAAEEYSYCEWLVVYDEYVEDKDNVLVKSGYSGPKTFE